MKNIEVLKHFISNSELVAKSHNNNLITKHKNIMLINYNTIIARKERYTKNLIVINANKYSITTTKIQNALIKLLQNNNIQYKLTYDYLLLDY